MNCQDFETIANELARQQMMEANIGDLALRHSADCEACAVKLADERALTQRLRTLASEMIGFEAPGMIEDDLLAAFRKNKFTQPRRSVSDAWLRWAAVAAAVFLIVIAIAALSMRSRWSPMAVENPSLLPLQPRIAAKTNDVVEPPVSTDQPKPTRLRQHGTVSARRNAQRHENLLPARFSSADSQNVGEVMADRDRTIPSIYLGDEIATDFMPVGYTSPMNLQDGGQVMRIELPRTALAGFGFPVNMERVNERVKADVLVGPDGQARAIRFVQ